jgi:hypothetical protein
MLFVSASHLKEKVCALGPDKLSIYEPKLVCKWASA